MRVQRPTATCLLRHRAVCRVSVGGDGMGATANGSEARSGAEARGADEAGDGRALCEEERAAALRVGREARALRQGHGRADVEAVRDARDRGGRDRYRDVPRGRARERAQLPQPRGHGRVRHDDFSRVVPGFIIQGGDSSRARRRRRNSHDAQRAACPTSRARSSTCAALSRWRARTSPTAPPRTSSYSRATARTSTARFAAFGRVRSGHGGRGQDKQRRDGRR
jgi:hypothetical protein